MSNSYERYHQASSWPPVQKDEHGERVTDETYRHVIPLKYDENIVTKLSNCILARKSKKAIEIHPEMDITHIGTLLKWAVGVHDDEQHRRAYPSAGALYPNEIYVAVKEAKNIESGLYQYLLKDHALAWVSRHHEIEDAFVQTDIDFNVCVIVAADLAESTRCYGERGYRFCLLEAGHIVQNIMLVASALHQSVAPIGGFKDDIINEKILPGNKNLTAFYLVPIGR
ncbi:SagB family peptide dehydrogenase [Geomicrobium sp. JCM 19039]|uniref:SagB family peptide dehydrogenase n=1 Tax=Geomicrobium sp. JCM 19039 TaxID=1460636 RepID=UPI00045F3B20|nr:SagB family peptide dehydrogenase [Geomicrobium sp. JCM 19039]GAK10483.1 hypothetical protein JCM19039_100 [Geomicrobium sp. JCM 19039]